MTHLFYRLRYVQEFKLFFPPPFDARYHLAPVTPEGNILPVDVPVSGFQLLQQPAFGHLPVPLEAVSPHIVGQYADEQGIAPQITEHAAQLVQIRPQCQQQFKTDPLGVRTKSWT